MFLRHLFQRSLTRKHAVALGVLIPVLAAGGGQSAIAQENLCSTPAMARLQQHSVAAGETLDSIANRYGLTAATLKGFNAATRGGSVTPGQTLSIPPYNGIQVNANGRTWEDLSAQYKVRPDVLFEVNGCPTQPTTAFIPGIKWVPGIETATVVADADPKPIQNAAALSGYPLRQSSALLSHYGWQLNPIVDRVVFHGGIDIAASLGDAVLSLGSGTVAYAAEQGEYGNLVVVNHANGLQSRYGQLKTIQVSAGQTVDRTTVLGTVGQTGIPSAEAPHLHFEMRLNSALGWVAQDPMPFLSERVGLSD